MKFGNYVMLSALAMLTIMPSAAAQPDTLWTKTYGGSAGDVGRSVQQTTDGGYIIAGYTSFCGAGGYETRLIKTDASGNELWYQTFGGTGYDEGYSVQQTSDGGYIIAGYTSSFGTGGIDVWLIKTDASGIEEWSQTYGGNSSDYGYSVQQTTDGGYVIAGNTYSYGADVYLIKTDESGNQVWMQTFGGSNLEEGRSVQQTSDGGYIIAGWTESYGAGWSDVYLIKTDASGIEQWSQTFGGSYDDKGYSVQQTWDGGYIITGYTEGYYECSNVYLIKTDVQGNELWTQTYGGDFHGKGYSVQQTTDGGYIMGCACSCIVGGYGIRLIKTDGSGNELWTKIFDEGYIDYGRSVQQTDDGGYIIAGSIYSYGAGTDFYLIRLAAETPVGPSHPRNLLNAFYLYPATPNPFNPLTTIHFDLPKSEVVSLVVYDIRGRLIATLVENWRIAGTHEVTFDGSNLASGMYIYCLQAGDMSASGKMVLMK